MLGGALCGAVSGIFIAKLKIPPFIATLGMMLIYKGLSLAICGAKPIYFNDTPGFTKISTGSLIGDVIPALPIPNGVLILFLVAIAAASSWRARCSAASSSRSAATRRRCAFRASTSTAGRSPFMRWPAASAASPAS